MDRLGGRGHPGFMSTTDALLVLAGVFGLAAELLRRHVRRLRTDWQSIRLSLEVGALRFAAGLVTQVLFVGTLVIAVERFAPWHLSADDPLVWTGFFLANELVDYLVHRAEHRLPFLWAAHVVHHSTEDYNLSAAARLSPAEAFYHPLLILWAPLFGVPVVVFASLGGGVAGHRARRAHPGDRQARAPRPLDRDTQRASGPPWHEP